MATNTKRFLAQYGLDANSLTLINVATPVNNTDAVNKTYVDTNYQPLDGDLTASAANVVVTSLGTLQRSTSSRKYKKNIQDSVHGLEELLSLRPVTFQSIKSDDEKTYSGFIAEEVHDLGLEEFVEYNDKGEPDAVYYSNMVSICVKSIQDQQKVIEDLLKRISTLENRG